MSVVESPHALTLGEATLLSPVRSNPELERQLDHNKVLYQALMLTSAEQFSTVLSDWQSVAYDLKARTLDSQPELLAGVTFDHTYERKHVSHQIEQFLTRLKFSAPIIQIGTVSAFYIPNTEKSVHFLESKIKKDSRLVAYRDTLKQFAKEMDTELGLRGDKAVRFRHVL